MDFLFKMHDHTFLSHHFYFKVFKYQKQPKMCSPSLAKARSSEMYWLSKYKILNSIRYMRVLGKRTKMLIPFLALNLLFPLVKLLSFLVLLFLMLNYTDCPNNQRKWKVFICCLKKWVRLHTMIFSV